MIDSITRWHPYRHYNNYHKAPVNMMTQTTYKQESMKETP